MVSRLLDKEMKHQLQPYSSHSKTGLTQSIRAKTLAQQLKGCGNSYQPVPASAFMTKMHSGVEQVFQREELRHTEKVWMLKWLF